MEKNFKNRATEHQKKFITGKGIEFKDYCILKDEDALQHQLFPWPGIIEGIEKFKKIKVKTHHGIVKNVFKNMLRSEHIPYNFFMPLILRNARDKVLLFFKKLLKRNDLSKIKKFEIEWTPKPIQDYLSDNTSFDTYIEFELADKKKLGVGIEVKFTEKSYQYTNKERSMLKSRDEAISTYFKFWNNKKVSVYNEDSYAKLGEKRYKQFFRNHLLGLSMINCKDPVIKIDEFISMHLYSEGNTYQGKHAKRYLNNIKSEMKSSFQEITFEKFIEESEKIFNDSGSKEWLEYLRRRYIVS